MREPTPTSQKGVYRPGTTPRASPLAPEHPWERAIATVVEDTPPLVDNVYHRLAGDHPPGMASHATNADLLDHWWGKLYGNGRLSEPDPTALAELYDRSSGDELKSLIAALRAREREQQGPPSP